MPNRTTADERLAFRIAAPTDELSAEVKRPIRGSRRIHIEGSRPDLRVPMREIVLTKTPTLFGGEDNSPVTVYDCSGRLYSDPTVTIDLAKGLAPLRADWIAERGDKDALPGITSAFGRARARSEAGGAHALPQRSGAARGEGRRNVRQMRYPRRGIVTPEMGLVAI